jgi:nucleotide-binding universal stress UspA family protein
MRIVVPLDGSELSSRAIPAAVAIARAAVVGITLLGVAADDSEVRSLSQHVHEAAQLLPSGVEVTEQVVVDTDPVAVLLQIATDPGRVLCVASRDHMPAAAAVRRSVGSRLIERAFRPLLVVGDAAEVTGEGSDIVVALDGQHDPEPLLAAAVTWARLLDAPLRLVTVYEPVLADIRRGEHFTRTHGPSIDPDVYLEQMRARLDGTTIRGIELAAISDPVSVAAGLSGHLAQRPALVLVAGAQHHRRLVAPGVLRELLRAQVPPVLLVPSPAEQAAWVRDAAGVGVASGADQ